jgi:hypothetical protein
MKRYQYKTESYGNYIQDAVAAANNAEVRAGWRIVSIHPGPPVVIVFELEEADGRGSY